MAYTIVIMKKQILLSLGAGLVVLIAIVSLVGYNNMRLNAEYNDIQAAVKAQKFADDLHNLERARYDCKAQNGAECEALRYYVTADKCDEVVEGIVQLRGKENPDCQATQSKFVHNGHNFGALLAKLDVGYQLTVWSLD